MLANLRVRFAPVRMMAVGFALIILVGALLLTLPIASRSAEPTRFVDALFTATSATCVTGLVVYDTYAHFSSFGQIVILALIQIGGLGFMTVASLFALFIRKRIGLYERSLLMESMNNPKMGGIVRMMRHIALGTLIIELVGAALLSVRFVPLMGWRDGILNGVFHSVSGFCNAGFDLMGRYEAFSSLVRFRADPLVNLTIMGLIVVGGLGFIVWEDIFRKRWRVRSYALHTKLVLIATASLILLGAALYFVAEHGFSLSGLPLPEQVLASFFQSVTARTAGFNTTDFSRLSQSGVMLICALMAVGGSPGSTAGGLKTTTIVVMLASLLSQVARREHLQVLRRRLEDGIGRRAFSIVTIYLSSAFGAMFVILLLQPGLSMVDVALEVFSAIGTVGLSTGITRELSLASKLIVLFLMYAGRVGSLTVVLAVAERRAGTGLRPPIEKITIG